MIDHPYTELVNGRWMRGNLHAHSNRSDGSRPVQEVINDYAARGHDFLMMSDHDLFTSSADLAQFQSHGMILIAGNEISAHGPHLLHVGADRLITPHADRQQVITEILQSTGFAVMNHPNWERHFDHCSITQLCQWQGYVGLEIFNGVIGRLHGSPYATNKWDMLLTDKRRVWGFANDDSHSLGDVALGWNVVWVEDPTAEGIVQALASGRFYASTGVTIRAIEVNGNRIRIETDNARRVVALRDTGQRIAVCDDNAIEVAIPDKAIYVRFECWGDGESFAWTQPFWNGRL